MYILRKRLDCKLIVGSIGKGVGSKIGKDIKLIKVVLIS